MSDIINHSGGTFSKHSLPSFLVEISRGFAAAVSSVTNVQEFVLHAQNGMYNKKNPDIVEVLINIQRNLAQMDKVCFVEVLQAHPTSPVSPRNRMNGFKCESIGEVCHLLHSYLAQRRRALSSSSNSPCNSPIRGSDSDSQLEAMETQVNIIMKPWLDIDNGCEFRIFIIGVHIHGESSCINLLLLLLLLLLL
jgi:hypothetical protein